MSRKFNTIEEWLGEDNTIGKDYLKAKYFQPDEDVNSFLDRISAPNDDRTYFEEFREVFEKRQALPGGRILAGRGTSERTSLANCYVLGPLDDSTESIMQLASEVAETSRTGGGVGFNISNLRPAGAATHNASRTTSGPLSFAELFDKVVSTFGIGRRGASIIWMNVDHPDIFEFIGIKADLNKINSANISVMVDNDFMYAVQYDKNWDLKAEWVTGGQRMKIRKTVRARDLLYKLAENNWKHAEPGMGFQENVNRNLLELNDEFNISASNPCGEIFMPAGGACNLAAVNLYSFVNLSTKEFDFFEFKRVVSLMTVYLDLITTEGRERHALQSQRDFARDWRMNGLGLAGLADAFIGLELRYGSQESQKFLEKVMKEMLYSTFMTSVKLAREKGAYLKFDLDRVKNSRFYFDSVAPLLTMQEVNEFITYGMRNATLLACAPTGSISQLLGTSFGVEPLFALSSKRRVQHLESDQTEDKFYTTLARSISDKDIDITGDTLPNYCITAEEVPIKERINIQAIMQKYMDNSISSTVNLPETTTIEEIVELYQYAWKVGCKGITVYRANSWREAIVSDANKTEKVAEVEEETQEGYILRGQEEELNGEEIARTIGLRSGCGRVWINTLFDGATGNLKAVFVNRGKDGGCQSNLNGLSRMISLAARLGGSIEQIVDQLDSVPGCTSCAFAKGKGKNVDGTSCANIIKKAILSSHEDVLEFYSLGEGSLKPPVKQIIPVSKPAIVESNEPKCPECGASLIKQGACFQCSVCAYSKCD
jgi:ribonucleoside-diphosphate reductase alpha chain